MDIQELTRQLRNIDVTARALKDRRRELVAQAHELFEPIQKAHSAEYRHDQGLRTINLAEMSRDHHLPYREFNAWVRRHHSKY